MAQEASGLLHRLRIERTGRDGTYGSIGNLLLLMYWEPPTFDILKGRAPMIRELVAAYPNGVGVFSIMLGDAGGNFPDAATRKESARQMQEHGSSIVSAAVVLEGDSVYFTLMRSLLRGLVLMSRQSFRYRFCKTTAEAGELVLGDLANVPGTPSKSALREAIDAMRKAGEPAGETSRRG